MKKVELLNAITQELLTQQAHCDAHNIVNNENVVMIQSDVYDYATIIGTFDEKGVDNVFVRINDETDFPTDFIVTKAVVNHGNYKDENGVITNFEQAAKSMYDTIIIASQENIPELLSFDVEVLTSDLDATRFDTTSGLLGWVY